jgi:5-carboxymethyl-2-hydroxymuconate isomerase
MPHIIVEYARGACPELQLPSMLDAVHQAVADSGLFATDNIKTRLLNVDAYRLAVQYQYFIAVQCRIHPGRSSEQKQALSQSILKAIQLYVYANTVITVEVIEMDRNSYAKGIGKTIV